MTSPLYYVLLDHKEENNNTKSLVHYPSSPNPQILYKTKSQRVPQVFIEMR